MKKQKVALYLVAFSCFLVCFIVLNRKYDPFYRINGINNETRQLIINYLTEEEQAYLIENSFPTDRFLRFLQDEDFHLMDLEYYEKIEAKFNMPTHETIMYTNQLLEKIKTNGLDVEYTFNTLLDSNLQDCYLQSEAFDMKLLGLYEIYSETQEEIVADDIEQLNALNKAMDVFRMSTKDKTSFLQTWADNYRLQDLIIFWELKKENAQLELVENPQSLTTVISQNQTVAAYEPTPLNIPYEVSRVRFGTYLRQDANAALIEMVDALSEAIPDETLLLVDAYHSFSSFEADYSTGVSEIRPGSSEYQLGLSVDLMVMDVAYRSFEDTKSSAYLKEHSWEFGFIQRYADQRDPRYSANTYRFVGKDAAKVIHEKGLTLEAYEGIDHE